MMFRRLNTVLVAKAVSDVGTALDYIAFNMLVWLRTASPLATGCLLGGLYLGGTVGGRMVSWLEPRLGRRRLLIGADLIRGLAVALLAVMPDHVQLFWMYPTVFVVGIGRAVFEAALAASLPNCAGPRLQWYNSCCTALRAVALMVGMAGAAVAVSTWGFRTLFVIDAVTYLLSAATLWWLPAAVMDVPVETAARPQSDSARWAGLSPLLSRTLGVIIGLRGIDAFGSGAHHVGLPMLGTAIHSADPVRAYGFLWAAWAMGLIVASFGLRPLFQRQFTTVPRQMFFLATASMSFGFIGAFWLPHWWSRVVAITVAGMGDGLSEIGFRQLLQRAPDAQRGVLFGLAESVQHGGLIFGILFTGIVATPTSIPQWVLLLHGIPLVSALACVIVKRR